MKTSHGMTAILSNYLLCIVACAQVDIPESLDPIGLTPNAKSELIEVAAQCEVFILGELHGTKEIPSLAASLLRPLTEQGYGVLAMEIPADERIQLFDWAIGKSEVIPKFFSRPSASGRGGVEVLSLIRTALSPPFSWKLICFDETREQSIAEYRRSIEQQATSLEDSVEYYVQRERRMAKNFFDARTRLNVNTKTLVICGNLHARTHNRVSDKAPITKLWPCFAALLTEQKRENDEVWRVRSVNVVPVSGRYFAAVGNEGVGRIHTIGGSRGIRVSEMHALVDGYWDWELKLPHVSPSTFLAIPTPFLRE